MLQPSSLQLEGDNIQTENTPLATGLQDLLGGHGNDLSYSCHGKNTFLSTAVVDNVPSDIMLDLGSPSRELLPAEDLVAGLGSPSVAVGMDIDELDFGHSFGYDSFLCMEEPVLGPSGDFGGGVVPSGCVDTDWSLSLSFEGGAVPAEQSLNTVDSWRDESELNPNSTGLSDEGHSDPHLSQGSNKQVRSSCGPVKKIPSKTSHHDSTLLPTVHIDHQHGSHTSQKSDTAFPATSAAPGSVAAACSECPEQEECTGVSSACELPFPELSVQENDLLPAAEDALANHRQAHLPGQPGDNTNSSSLDARILLDHLDSLDTQNVFETCSGLEIGGQIKLELCRDLHLQVDAFGQSTKYLEALTLEEQCNSNSWTAERSGNLETGPVDCSSSTRQVDVTNSSLDAQSASGQRSGRLETMQDILWGEDQAGQPVVLETVVLTGDQPTSIDGQAIVCTLYNSSLDQGEVILSCDDMKGTHSCALEADAFATQSTYSALAHQLLEATEASQGNIVCNSNVGFPQLSDVYDTCETVPSQPTEVTMVGQGTVASDSSVGYPQVLEMELDTLTTTCEAVISQLSKGILASQGHALCDSRIGFPRVLDLDMLASASEVVVSQPSDVTLACQDGSFNKAGVSGDTLSCSSFANEAFVLQQPNDVRSSNRVHLTDTLLVHVTAAAESEKTATQGPSDLQVPLPVDDVAIADQQSDSAPNTSMEIQTDASLMHLTAAVESEKTSAQAQTDHEFPLPVTDIASTDQQSDSAPNTSLEIETDQEKKQSSVCSARSRPKRCYEMSDKRKAEKESTTKCPRLFPPRLCNTNKSAQETHASSQKDGESNGGEISAEGMEASPKSPITLKVPFQIKQYPENIYICPFDSEKGSREVPSLAQFPLDEATGRISTFLALTEKCQAGSREASEKLKRIISARSVGKVKTGQGEFCFDGNYIRQKTVRQMLQDTGFERQECDIKLPVGRPAHKLRNGLHTHKKLSPQKPDPGVLNGKGEAGKKRKAEEPALAGETDDEALQHHSKWKIARCTVSCKNTDLGSLHVKSSEQTEVMCDQNTGADVQCGEPQITGEQSAQDARQCQQQSVEQSIKGAVQYSEQSVGGDIQYGEHQSGEQSVRGGSVKDGGHQTSEQSFEGGSVQDGERQTSEQSVREGSVQDGEQQDSEQSVREGSVQDGEQQSREQSVRAGSVQDGEQQPREQSVREGSVQDGEQQDSEQSVREGSVQDDEQQSREQSVRAGSVQDGEQQDREQSVRAGSVQDDKQQSREQSVREGSVQDGEQQDSEQSVREGSVQDGEQQSREQSVRAGSVLDGEQQDREQSVRAGSVQDGEQQSREQSVRAGSVQDGEQQDREQSVRAGSVQDGEQQSREQSVREGSVQDGEQQSRDQSVRAGSVQDGEQQSREQSVRAGSVQDGEQQSREQSVRAGSVQDGEQQSREQSVREGSVQDGEQQTSGQTVEGGSVQDGEQHPVEQPTGGSVKHGEQAAEQSDSRRVLPPPCVEHKSNERKEVGDVVEAGLCTCSERDETNKENKKWIGTGRAHSRKREKHVQNEKETVAGTGSEGKETAVLEEQSVSLISQSPRPCGTNELCEECGKQVVSSNVLCGEQLETSEHVEKINKDFDKMVAGAALQGRKPRGGEHDEGATLCDEHHDIGEQVEESDRQMVPRTVLPGEQQHTFEQRAGVSCDQVVIETHSSDEQQQQKSEDTAQCPDLEQQKEQEELSSMWHPNIEDQGVPDDPEVHRKCQSSRLEEPCSFSCLEPHIFPRLEPHIFPHLESKSMQHQVDKGTGKQTLKVCGQNQTLPNGVSTADQFRESRKRSKSDKQSKRDQSHGQETKGAVTAGESSTCALLHNRKKLTKAPDSILFDIEGEGASKSTHIDAEDEEGDSCSIICTGINGGEKSGCIHVNAEDECDSISICFDVEDRRSPNAEDYNPDFKDLGGCGSTQTETKSKCHSDSIPIGTKVKDGSGCVHTDTEGEQQSVCVDLEAETTPDIKDMDDFDGIQAEAQSKGDCDNPPTDARSKEGSDSVNVYSDDECDKDCSLNNNAMSGGALQSQTVITIPSCESVNCESSVLGVCDEESTIVAESHSMNDPASSEDCDCESENQAVITSKANPELDLNSLPIVEKHGKFLDSETLHNGDIETLYRTPFILVIHQSPQSASQSTTSKADARHTVTEGTAPVSVEDVTESLHENNTQTGAQDSGIAVHSATHKSHATENLLYTENMPVSVPTDNPDFVDLKDLLELDCQGEPPDSDSHSLLVDNETLHSLGTRLSCSGSADVADSTRYSSHGPRYAAEGSLTEDGSFLGASSYVMGDRVVTASAAPTGFTGDSTCTTQPAFVPLTAAADLPEEDDVTAMPHCASVEDGAHLAANYVHENFQGTYAFVESGRANACAPTTHFPSLALSSTPSTMRLADFVGECAPVTALEDFMGDCFSGAPVDFVGDCDSTVSPELVGDAASASRQEAGGGVVDFSAVASAGFHAPAPLPNLTDTAEVSETLTGNGMHPGLVCTECLNPDGPYGQSGQNGTQEVAGGVACQVHCVDGPGSVSAQISPGSESKDSFVFESRCDLDRLTPALPVVSITKPEVFLPVVQEFRVLSVSEHDSSLLNSDSDHSKSSGTCDSTHAELHTPEVTDSIEKSDKNCSTSSHHQILPDGSDENPVFQELQKLNQNFVVGTKMLTEHENHIQNTLHASEPDPLEIWMENRSDSANQSISTQNVKNASENGSPNNKFLVVVEAPKTAVPKAQDIVDSCIENYFPDLLTACLDSSLWKPDANIPTTRESSTDILMCFTTAAVGSDTPTNVFESGDDVQNQNNSGDSNSCFDMLFQALDQHSVSVCSGQAIHSAAAPPIKSACKALHTHDSCPSLMPVQDPCPAVLSIQHSRLTATGVHDACSAVTLPDIPSPSPVVVDVPASSEAFGRHASSSGDEDHFRTEATDDLENVYLSQISLSTTFPEDVCSYTSFESAKLKVTDPLKILDAQDSGRSQQALSSCPPETFTLSDLASLLPGNVSKSDAASVPGASIRPSLSLTSLTDVQDCVSSVNLASVMSNHQFSEVGDVVNKDKSLDNSQSHVPRQSSPLCTPGLFSYTTIPASLAVSCAPLSFGGSQLRCSLLSMTSSSTATAPIATAFSPPKDKVPVISASSHFNSQLFLKQENESSSLQPLGHCQKAWSKISESDSIPVNLLVSSLFQGQIPSTADMISVTSASALPVCIPTASGTSLLLLSGSSGLSAPSPTVTASAKHISGLFETKPVLSSLLQVNPSHPGPALRAEGACSLTGLSSSAAKLPKGLSSFSCETVTSSQSLSLKQHSVAQTHSDTSLVNTAHSCLTSTLRGSDPPNPALETSAGSSMHQSADTPGVTLPPPAVVASGRTCTPTPIGGTFSPDTYSTALELLSLSSRCAQFSHPSTSPVGAGSRNMSAELASRSLPACLSRAVTSTSCSGYGSMASIYASSTRVCVPERSHAWSSAACPVDSLCLLATTSVSSAVAVTVCSRTAKPSAHWSSAAHPVDSLCSLATTSVSSAVAVAVCSRTAKPSAHLPPLTLSSMSPSALWTSSVKFVITPVPSNRFHPSCPCHPLTLDTGGKTPGPPCIPFSPAMLNCPTMKATPPVMACPDDLPQNPCCISEGVYKFSPSAADIHMAQVMYRNFHEGGASSSSLFSKPFKSYKISTICIGDFTFTAANKKYSKASSVCFSYREKKVFYNMVLTQPVSDEDWDGRQQVVCTEINFSSIVGLWGQTNKLLLELSTVPDMFLASRTVRLHSSIKKRKAIDITGGQIRRVPYHFLLFQAKGIRHLKHSLCEDPFFCSLLIRPVTIDLYKAFPLTDRTPGFPDQSGQLCRCKGTHGCRQGKCLCMKLGHMCTGRCACRNCQNPFNQFHGLGLSLSEVQSDRCLMDRLGQLKDIGSFLDTPVELKCCGAKVKFLDCVPNLQHCPKCSALIGLSWCFATVFIESQEPRKHCDKCKKCTKSFQKHCEACGRCRQWFKGQCLKCMRRALGQYVSSCQV